MNSVTEEHRITTVTGLEALYGAPAGAAVAKEIDHLHPHYQAMIAASVIVSWRARSNARQAWASGVRWAMSAGRAGSSSAREGLTIRV